MNADFSAIKKINYIFYIIKTTPYFLYGISLNVISSFLAVIGIPMLLPALDMLDGSDSIGSESSLAFINKFVFEFFDLNLNFSSLVLSAGLLIILSQFILFLVELFNIKIQILVIKRLMQNSIKGFMKSNWETITSENSGKFHSVILREIIPASEAHLDTQRLLSSVIQSVVYIYLSLIISMEFSMIIGIFFFSILSINFILGPRVNELSSRYNNNFIQLSSLISGITTNRKFFKSSRIKKILDNVIDKTDYVNNVSFRLNMLTSALSSISILLGLFLLISILLFHREIGVNSNELIILFAILIRLTPIFRDIADSYVRITERLPIHKSVLERLRNLNHNEEIFGTKHFDFQSLITFNKVLFKHGKKTILSNLNLAIPPQKTTAIIGGSGSGKTTILDLLMGLYNPNDGKIMYGDNSNLELDYESFRANVSYIGQETTLFDGSIKHNLSISSDRELEDSELDFALNKAGIKDFIDSLPSGINTEIGENGINLSGGQRQRIALARALVNKPKLLILDEATSNLDAETEKFVQESISNLSGEMTIVIVAHRLSTIRDAESIHFIDKGHVIESGNYEDLLSKKGRLFDFQNLQE